MVYGDLQFFDIIIFAGIALFLIYRLRNVLGKRGGFEKKTTTPNIKIKEKNKEAATEIPQLKDSEQKLSSAYKSMPDFDHKKFLEGAKYAFETIINAFNKSDKKTLKTLLTPDVYSSFEKAIDEGNNNPNYQFYSLLIDGIHDANVEKGKITIAVNFISEQILSGNEEDIIKNKYTWVFEKRENSSGPAWTLIST